MQSVLNPHSHVSSSKGRSPLLCCFPLPGWKTQTAGRELGGSESLWNRNVSNKYPETTPNHPELQSTALSLKSPLLLPFFASFFPIGCYKTQKSDILPLFYRYIRFPQETLTWNLSAGSHQELCLCHLCVWGRGHLLQNHWNQQT